MDAGVRWDDRGKGIAPDQYALTLHPDDVETLLSQAPQLHDDWPAGWPVQPGRTATSSASEPEVTLAADPTLGRWDVRVVAWHHARPGIHQGHAQQGRTEPGRVPAGAFLIVDGDKHFPLDRPVATSAAGWTTRSSWRTRMYHARMPSCTSTRGASAL